MSAHYHYAKLPARELPDDPYRRNNMYDNPGAFQCKKLGQISIGFVHGSEYLLVFQDKISGTIFFLELNNGNKLFEIKVFAEEWEYRGCDKEGFYSPEAQFNKVFSDEMNITQFKHYIMGWKPSVWDYDTGEREALCQAVDEAVKLTKEEYD